MPIGDDDVLRSLLGNVRTIAVVGISPKPDRPSHEVAAFLKARGYRIIPVNPGHAGETILGETVFASLSAIGERIDMVDIFRNSEAAGAVVDEAIAAGAGAVWMQLGVVNPEAAARAEAAGLKVVMDHCPKIEIGRLGIGAR